MLLRTAPLHLDKGVALSILSQNIATEEVGQRACADQNEGYARVLVLSINPSSIAAMLAARNSLSSRSTRSQNVATEEIVPHDYPLTLSQNCATGGARSGTIPNQNDGTIRNDGTGTRGISNHT